MERNTQIMAKHLSIGDRFYKAADKKKTVLQMVEHKARVTQYQTYTLWCIPDGRDKRYPNAIKGDTEVIFLRHTDNN